MRSTNIAKTREATLWKCRHERGLIARRRPRCAAFAVRLLTYRPGYLMAGTGTPVVMLHSSLGSKSQWTALAERLASRFRVIALDLCGYGDNALPDSAASFALDEEVWHVVNLLDQLVGAHVRVHLVGHSYGGLVALRLAQCRSDRVASLSLYELVVFRMLDDEDAELADARRLAERVSGLVAAGRRRDAAQVFVDFWSGDGSYASLPLPAQVSLARRVDKFLSTSRQCRAGRWVSTIFAQSSHLRCCSSATAAPQSFSASTRF